MLPQRTLVIGGQLVLLALIAFFAATTVNGVVAAALHPEPVVDLSPPEPASEVVQQRPLAAYSAITRRDIFNPPRASESRTVAVANLNARLLGTAPAEGIDSYAIIEDGARKKQELYRVGDKIQNRTLVRIEWHRVFLRNGTREEMLEIEEANKRSPSSPAVAEAAGDGIEEQGENEYLIARSEVDEAMENMNQLFTQIRAVPHFQDGKANGFRLFAIRRNSIFQKIGLRNGDIIQSINGNPLTDPARGMEMIQELRDQNAITVEVVRNRQPSTLSYEIR